MILLKKSIPRQCDYISCSVNSECWTPIKVDRYDDVIEISFSFYHYIFPNLHEVFQISRELEKKALEANRIIGIKEQKRKLQITEELRLTQNSETILTPDLIKKLIRLRDELDEMGIRNERHAPDLASGLHFTSDEVKNLLEEIGIEE